MTERKFDDEAAWRLMPCVAQLDEEERPEHPMDEVKENGEVVGIQTWDSGGPGAGGGELLVYRYAEKFFAEDDVECMGPYDTFEEATEAVGLFRRTDATRSVWVVPGLLKVTH